MNLVTIKNLYVFVAVAALLVGYILYTMIRPRKGLRPDSRDRDNEL